MTVALAGAVVWAVVPSAPEAPFRLYAGDAHPPIQLPRPAELIAAGRRGEDSEFTFLVPAKAQPVLVVSDRVDPRLRELLALRLMSVSALDADEQDVARAQGDPGLLHLDPARFSLRDERAAVIASLVRVHESAIDRRPAGRLEENELRSLHERVARHYGLGIPHLVRAELQRLAATQRQRGRR